MLVEVDIVRKLKERDIAAFGRLYDCYAPALYGMILKLTPDDRVATAILEKSFLNFWLQIDAFDSEKDKLYIWMVRITIKQCTNVIPLTNEIILQKLAQKTPSKISAPTY